jgi:leucyl aminopeptidase (aminopeptidase T)
METPTLAKRVVNESLQITKSDNVLVYCNKQTIDLAEGLALECQKAGAHASVILSTDALAYDVMLERPIEFLETPNPFDMAGVDLATIAIDMSGPEDPAKLEKIAPERWTALNRGNEPYLTKLLKSKQQAANIGLGLVTPQRAKVYGFDHKAWKDNVYAAVDVDYGEMRRVGTKLRTALETAKEIRITNAAGADFTARIQGGQIRVDDGAINRKDIEKTIRSIDLPGGSVTIVPDLTSVKGTFVSDVGLPLYGRLVKGLTWKFDKGTIVSFEGRENIELLKSICAKGTGDKTKFGFIQIGLNPNAKIGFLHNWIARGAVTVGIGDNRWYGGKNASSVSWAATSASATLKLDNKTLVDKGKLVL